MSLLAITSLDRQWEELILRLNEAENRVVVLEAENSELKQRMNDYVKTRRDDSSENF
jgi:low affinity Fe/Cu permease